MKKKFVFLLIASIVCVAGCNSILTSSSENQLGKTVETQNNLNISVKKIETGYGITEKNDMLQISFEIKNIGKDVVGIGAADFKIKTDKNKFYSVYGLEEKNFGSEIKAGKSLKGKGYYEVPQNTKRIILYYEPNGKTLSSWELEVPNK